MTEPLITAREFDIFMSRFNDLVLRVDTMDRNGTRGQGAIEVTIAEIGKDVSEHKTEHVQVKNSLRNLVGAMVVQIAAIIGTYLQPVFMHGKR